MNNRVVLGLKLLALTMGVSVISILLFKNNTYAVNYNDFPGGYQFAVDRDTECYNAYWGARAGSSNLKTVTNGSAYNISYWLSDAANTGNTQIAVDASSGAAISLKINYLTYICYGATAPGDSSLGDIDARMSDRIAARDGHDVAPAPWKGYSNSPNKTYYGFGLYGISVNGGAANGTISSFSPGAQVIAGRDDGTRFWRVDSTFDYKPPSGGFTKDTTVNITAKVRWISQYYYRYNPKSSWQIDCDGGKWNDTGTGTKPPAAHSSLPDRWFTDRCNDSYVGLSINFKVKNQYDLTPVVTGSAAYIPEGSSLHVSPAVKNAGPTVSTPVDWNLVAFSVPRGQPLPTTGTGTQTPIAYYKNGAKLIDSGNRAFPVDTSTGTLVADADRIAPQEDVGTRVCWALAVRPYNQSTPSNEWKYGTPYCPVISKSPLVQVKGNDLLAGRTGSSSIMTNTKNLNGTRYGSWSEYGIIASGLVSGMASASGYTGGTSAATLCGVSYLTFSNQVGLAAGCSDGQIGYYVLKSTASTIVNRFPTNAAAQLSGLQSIDGLASGATYTNDAAGSDILLTSIAKVPAGKWVVINAPNATVRIMNNIVYTDGALPSISQIPQVVIIAKNIIISDAVTQVDAWLVATGTGATDGRVNTCAIGGVNEAAVLTSLVCTNKLTVNGPVIANHLLLYRTAGAGTGVASGDPAEVFNLRPDAYLWAANLQTSTVKAQTVRTIELPPRY